MRRKIRGSTVSLPHVQTIHKGDKVYRYARPPKGKRVRLPDLPMDHPEFLAAYADAMQATAPLVRAPAGTIAAMVEGFRRSPAWQNGYSESYRKALAIHFEAIIQQAEDAKAAHLRAAHIHADIAALPPNAAARRLKAWRLVCAFGKRSDLLTEDPSEGVKRVRIVKTEGYLPWTRDHIDAFRARWPLESPQRLCMEVLLWTGARIADSVMIGEGMVGRDGVLCFRQTKTGHEAFVPWTCPLPDYAVHLEEDRDTLHAALAARKQRHMTFLATAWGKTRSHKAVSNYISQAAAAAGFDRSAHGLRKSRAIALAEGGATAHAIAAWTGHVTLSEVQHYTEKMNRRNAVRGTEQKQNSVNQPDPSVKSGNNPFENSRLSGGLATPPGLEPGTCGLEVRRSIQLS